MLSDKIDIPKYLNDYGIRPTAVRIIVFRAMYELHDTFSLKDLENTLDSMDKSTLFRTLSLFVQYHLVHNPQVGQFSAKATDGAVVWSWKAHIQEEDFAEEDGAVDPFFDSVITQAVPCLKQ